MKHPSLANDEKNLKSIWKSNDVNGESPNSSDGKQLSRSSESSKNEDSDEYTATVKPKYSRVNIHLRKDVINKTILRAFIRFYTKYFKPRLNMKDMTRSFLYQTLHQNVNEKITSLANYQEYFNLVDDDSESKFSSFNYKWILLNLYNHAVTNTSLD